MIIVKKRVCVTVAGDRVRPMVMSCEGVFCGRRVGSRDEVSSKEECLSHLSALTCGIGFDIAMVLAVGCGAQAQSKGIWWMPWH